MIDREELEKIRQDGFERGLSWLNTADQRAEQVRLRDQFAAAVFPACHAAMINECVNRGYPNDWRNQIVREAYEYADAMLHEREKSRAGKNNVEARKKSRAGNIDAETVQKAQKCTEREIDRDVAPIAWAVIERGDPWPLALFLSHADAELHASRKNDIGQRNCEAVPLYRAPAITAEERSIVQACLELAEKAGITKAADTLRALLERLG